jgi:hypothetical protein
VIASFAMRVVQHDCERHTTVLRLAVVVPHDEGVVVFLD